jgi:hypothetical protein
LLARRTPAAYVVAVDSGGIVEKKERRMSGEMIRDHSSSQRVLEAWWFGICVECGAT